MNSKLKLEKQSEEIEICCRALLTRKEEIEHNINKRYLTNDTISNPLEFCAFVADGLQNPTFEDKRYWLEIVQVEVAVKNSIAVITCGLPIEPFIVDLSNPNSNSGNNGNSNEKRNFGFYGLRTSRSLRIKR